MDIGQKFPQSIDTCCRAFSYIPIVSTISIPLEILVRAIHRKALSCFSSSQENTSPANYHTIKRSSLQYSEESLFSRLIGVIPFIGNIILFFRDKGRNKQGERSIKPSDPLLIRCMDLLHPSKESPNITPHSLRFLFNLVPTLEMDICLGDVTQDKESRYFSVLFTECMKSALIRNLIWSPNKGVQYESGRLVIQLDDACGRYDQKMVSHYLNFMSQPEKNLCVSIDNVELVMIAQDFDHPQSIIKIDAMLASDIQRKPSSLSLNKIIELSYIKESSFSQSYPIIQNATRDYLSRYIQQEISEEEKILFHEAIEKRDHFSYFIYRANPNIASYLPQNIQIKKPFSYLPGSAISEKEEQIKKFTLEVETFLSSLKKSLVDKRGDKLLCTPLGILFPKIEKVSKDWCHEYIRNLPKDVRSASEVIDIRQKAETWVQENGFLSE